jgi:predicted secreted protein
MAVGAGTVGRNIILTMAGDPIAGVQSKDLTVNNEPLDVTDDDSEGYRLLMAEPGNRSLDISVSGVTKNLELLRAISLNDSQIYAFLFTWEDGSTLAVDAFFQNFSETGETGSAATFQASFQSSGEWTFTPFVP